MKIYKDDISIVLCGEAGSGVQTVENVVSKIFKAAGYNLFTSKEYMSRIRGGSNSTQIRVSSRPVNCYTDRIDIFIPLDKLAVEHLYHRITENTFIIADEKAVGQIDKPFSNVAFADYAKEAGGAIYSNIIASSVILGIFKVDFSHIEKEIKDSFTRKGEAVVNSNIQAAKKGYEVAEKISQELTVDVKPNSSGANEILVSGADAISLGALAGGCDFISSYPMTPGTSVFMFLAKNQKEFGVAVEQAEDEIAAINMAIGASFAGARSMVSTSGGGFALMCEGVSLSAATETPVVIHLAQRPGPATGLPTRTEQADLELALYSGHGEFPRAIFAPGTPRDCYEMTQKAFDIADKYQIPVFILSDQYMVDSISNCKMFDKQEIPVKHIFEMPADYMRYRNTENGVSPRGVPGYGKGLICVDSDEHDETGHITESENMRDLMHRKRLKKYDELVKEVVEPEFSGNQEFENLVICWGSTADVCKEALSILGDSKTALLYFKQVYPLHPKTLDYIRKAKQVVFVENNATGQFENLVRKFTCMHSTKHVHKYDGLPFSADKLAQQIKSVLEVK